MPRPERDREAAELFNNMAANPIQRINFTRNLVEGLGSALMIHTPIFEQIIAAEERDLKIMLEQQDDPTSLEIFKMFARFGIIQAKQQIAILKAFKDVRPQFIEAMKRHGAEKIEEIPE
jgi:hypothetical protein